MFRMPLRTVLQGRRGAFPEAIVNPDVPAGQLAIEVKCEDAAFPQRLEGVEYDGGTVDGPVVCAHGLRVYHLPRHEIYAPGRVYYQVPGVVLEGEAEPCKVICVILAFKVFGDRNVRGLCMVDIEEYSKGFVSF